MHAEGDDFVDDEHGADLGRRAPDHLDEGRGHRHEAEVAGRRVDDDRRDAVPIGEDDALGGRHIVKRDHHDVVLDAFGHALRIADRLGILAPVFRRGIQADFRKVVRPVIHPFRLDDLRATGQRARRLDRAHDRFRPGVGKPHPFETLGARADRLRQRDFRLRRQCEGRPLRYLLLDGSDNCRMRVTVDQRSEIIQQIHAAGAVDVGHVRPRAAARIYRKRLLPGQNPSDTARHDLDRTLVKRFRLTMRFRPFCCRHECFLQRRNLD